MAVSLPFRLPSLRPLAREAARLIVFGACGVLAASGLSACSSRDPNALATPRNHLLGVDRGAEGGADSLQGGVNAYLWRGALDTLSFMPLASADGVGGVILTGWYSPPTNPDERFKIGVYVLDKRMRSDALRVVIFRQLRLGGKEERRGSCGAWEDAPVAATTVSDITARILERARQLRAHNKIN